MIHADLQCARLTGCLSTVSLYAGEVKISDMNWNNVVVMTVGTWVKEMDAAMIGVTLTGEILC